MRRVAVTALLFLQIGPAAPQEREPDPFQNLWKPIDLDLTDVDPREALEKIFEQAGESLELPKTISDKKISIHLKGVSFWQAVDEVCRLHGDLRHPARLYKERKRQLHGGTWIDFPVWYRGPLRLSLYDAARVREMHYPERLDRTEVTLVLQWMESFIPVRANLHQAGTLRLSRVEDDTGKSLLPLMRTDGEFDFHPGQALGSPSSIWVFRLQPTAAGAKHISLLEGEWEGAYLTDIEEVSFEKPDQSVGSTRRVGPMTIALSECKKETGRRGWADSYDFKLRLSYEAEATEEQKESLKLVSMSARILIKNSVGDGSYLLPADKPIDPASAELRGYMPSLGALTFRVGKTVLTKKASFSFKDIRLPEEDR